MRCQCGLGVAMKPAANPLRPVPPLRPLMCPEFGALLVEKFELVGAYSTDDLPSLLKVYSWLAREGLRNIADWRTYAPFLRTVIYGDVVI